MRSGQDLGRLGAEEVRRPGDHVADHGGLGQQMMAADPPTPRLRPAWVAGDEQPVVQAAVRIAGSARELPADRLDPDDQVRVRQRALAVYGREQVESQPEL